MKFAMLFVIALAVSAAQLYASDGPPPAPPATATTTIGACSPAGSLAPATASTVAVRTVWYPGKAVHLLLKHHRAKVAAVCTPAAMAVPVAPPVVIAVPQMVTTYYAESAMLVPRYTITRSRVVVFH